MDVRFALAWTGSGDAAAELLAPSLDLSRDDVCQLCISVKLASACALRLYQAIINGCADEVRAHLHINYGRVEGFAYTHVALYVVVHR